MTPLGLLFACVLGSTGCLPSESPYPTVLAYGDSKTASLEWQPLLSSSLGNRYHIATVARGSKTLSDMHALRVTDLASDVGRPRGGVVAVLINLGVNDISEGLPEEAVWKSRLVDIVDLMHVVWPSAKVYVVTPWYRAGAAECDTLAAWITDAIASKAWCALGHNERVWREGGDDGATMTSDGVHDSAVGIVEHARQWSVILGAAGY